MKKAFYRSIARVPIAVATLTVTIRNTRKKRALWALVFAVFAVPLMTGVIVPSHALAQSANACEGGRLSFGIARPGKNIYSGSLTYRYKTENGTAVAGNDYNNTTGKVEFSAGVNGARIYVQTLNDNINEGQESLTLQLSEPKASQYGGWIQQNGNWVRVETLLPSTISYTGYIKDGGGRGC